MSRFLSALALLVGLSGSAWAQSYIYTPPTSTPGVGTVTSITAGEGVDLDGTCGSGSTTTTGTLSSCTNINPQTGTTYTVLATDCGKQITLSNASAVAVTLPQAGSGGDFAAGCKIGFTNLGAGAVTITPTTSTIDGLAARVLQQYGGVNVISNGTNYVSTGVAPAVGADGIIDQDQIPTATTVIKGGVKASTCVSMSGASLTVSTNCRTASITMIIDGGGSAITTGVKGYIEVPFSCTISQVTMLADQSGSIVVDIWKDTYANYPPTDADSITASAVPTISAATKSQDGTITGWTTGITAGDILGFNVDSASTVTLVTVSLTCVKT